MISDIYCNITFCINGTYFSDMPFPRVNDTPAMQRLIRRIRLTSYLFVYGLPMLIGAAVSAYHFGVFS